MVEDNQQGLNGTLYNQRFLNPVIAGIYGAQSGFMNHPITRSIEGVAWFVLTGGIEGAVALGGAAGRWIGGSAARGGFTYTKSAAKHLTEVVKHGKNAKQLSRPYMNSPLTIQEIMNTGRGVKDATFKGGLNWRTPGTFRGTEGVWELGINPKTNVIYHFNFTY